MILTFLLLISSSYATAAGHLEQQYLRKLNRAASKPDVERLQSTYEHIHVLRLACRMQLQAARVPVSCFESLQVETSWALHSRTQAQVLKQDLNERCRKAAESLRLPKAEEDLTAVSKVCLGQIEEARSIEKYRDRGIGDWSGN